MKNISSKEAFDILSNDSNAIIVDVRTAGEWAGGVPDNAHLKLVTISSDLDAFGQNLQDICNDLKCPTLFICRGGVRSATAATIAEQLGYKDCYNITGGFTEWQHSNLPSKAWSIK
jgi:rhodanese-related sulfurtransferase